MEQALIQLLTQVAQQTAGMQQAQASMAAELLQSRQDMLAVLTATDRKAEARGRQWEDADRFKACVGFSGKTSEWDEWSDRLLATVKARSVDAHGLMRLVEDRLTEKTIDGDDYAAILAALDVGTLESEEVELMSAKLHLLLGNLTTGDAHAVVRRSRNSNGFLAWKRLTSSLNPKR